MGFHFCYANTTTGAIDSGTEVSLSPRPTRVIYPEEAVGKLVQTNGGSVVVQTQSTDNRLYSWAWDNFPDNLPAYQTLWTQIEPLKSRYRLLAGDTTPYVYLKEDLTGLLRTFSVTGTTVTSTYPFLRCRVIDVRRPRLREGSSLVTYAETRIDFVIDDPAYTL